LRFRATKSVKNVAKQASNCLREEHQRLLVSDDLHQPIPTKSQILQPDLRLETKELVYDFLTMGAHYNFPKMPLILHFTDQIMIYGSLSQYFIETYEVSRKPRKDAYYRSNYINAMPQIISTYMQAPSFEIQELNIQQWLTKLDHISKEIHEVIHPTCTSLYLPQDVRADLTRSKLQGYMYNNTIYSIHILQTIYELSDLQTLTDSYLHNNHPLMSSE